MDSFEADRKGLDKKKKPSRVPIARKGFGTKGNKIPILTNHFKVNISNNEGHFFHYNVSISYEDGSPVEGKGVGRKVIDRLQEIYASELARKHFAYDGDKNLFTVGPLPQNKFELPVVLDDITSSRNKFKVVITYTDAEIPIKAIANALQGQESKHLSEAIRVLDIVLRQHAAKQGALLVRQSFFHNNPRDFIKDVGGGILGCRGYHSSFRATQSGLSLNIDKSTTTIIQPGPVMDFLKANQNVQDPRYIDWEKAKRMLKNLRVMISPSNRKYKITGLSELPCREQKFSLKGKGGEDSAKEMTVYDYFVKNRNIDLRYSSGLPCIDVGKPNHPIFFPVELCSLVSMQQYTKSLSANQRALLVEKSRQKPQDMKSVLSDALKDSHYNSDPMFRDCGVSISTGFSEVEGRILQPPSLKFKNIEINPRDAKWNFNGKQIVQPVKITKWGMVNFSARRDVQGLVNKLKKCARRIGMPIEKQYLVFEESPEALSGSPMDRVGRMLSKLPKDRKDLPAFLLCLLPERKNSELYGPWKWKCLTELGVVTQCMAPPEKVEDIYFTNLLLKINAKLGGLNSMLSIEGSRTIPIVSEVPTMILGMDVVHGPPGQPDVPSIAAVVSSRVWPGVSRYRACLRTQSPKVEMIDNLFNRPEHQGKDTGIMSELLNEFYRSSRNQWPQNIIIFRDGVSESQFNQVLNFELDQIIKACKIKNALSPKFAVIVCQKNHYTKFFQPSLPDNVPPGTVIDEKICHPLNNDFYLCAHAGMIGTSRPTHYHVLLDEIGFSVDELQELVHSLSYVCQRSTTALSLVAPVYYAHLAAAQMGKIMKAAASTNPSPVTELPKLHPRIKNLMFFC